MSVTRDRINTFFRYKDLLRELVVRDVKLKYRRSFLGYVWSCLLYTSFGTYKTARAADKYGVKKFVLISTDKMCIRDRIWREWCKNGRQSSDSAS